MGLKVCLDGLKKDEVEASKERGDEPTVEATPPKDVVGAGEINLTAKMPEAVTTELDELCDEYVKADAREKAAKKAKDKAKAQLLKLFEKQDITERETLHGRFIIVVTKDSTGVLVKEAVKYLTEEQIKACTGVTRKGSTSLKFYPA